MKIKVCGIKDPANIEALSKLPIDLMGLIFYPKSPRYVEKLNPETLSVLSDTVERVGVFVNADLQTVIDLVERYSLNYVQLHGSESPQYCQELKSKLSIKIIKAFSIAESPDFDNVGLYQDVVDYFLFDTKTPQYGGSGQKFDWSILDNYLGKIPFLLSGGISATDVNEIKALSHPMLYGLDLNSKFEVEPGFKNIELLEEFINNIIS